MTKTKIRYGSEEVLLAMTMLAEELGFERRNHFYAHDLFIVSIGRVFLQEFSRQDAIDPEIMIHPRFQHACAIDGWSWTRRDDPEAYLRDKWSQRISIYLSAYGHQLTHIRDWLLVAAAEAHPWIANKDSKGRPKKLMKCGSVAQLMHEAEKWHRRDPVAEVAQRALGPDDVRWQTELCAGFHLVRLLSPEALDAETMALRHCIGRGSYDRRLEQPDYEYLSVRDGEGTPVATLEVFRGMLVQCRGVRNADPAPEVIAVVDRYMSERAAAEDREYEALVDQLAPTREPETDEQRQERLNAETMNFVVGLMGGRRP